MTQGTKNGLETALDHTLIDPLYDVMHADPSFDAALDVHGKYETMRFVLRLSPRNHELLEEIENGVHNLGKISSEAMQAYSTYIHETIHWWQHVGLRTAEQYSATLAAG